MDLLPNTPRILLGPGPSLAAPRVMHAMAAPTVGHLDPVMLAMLDDVRSRLGRLFRAPAGSLALEIWRVGLMGASSEPGLIVLLLAAFERAFAALGRPALA